LESFPSLWIGPMKRILYLVSEDWYFCQHRLPIAKEAIREGYEVFLLTRISKYKEKIEKEGITVFPIDIDRKSMNPFKEWTHFRLILQYIQKIQPDLLHCVSFKLSLLGSFCARFYNNLRVINSITGLGYLFTHTSILNALVRLLLRPIGWVLFQRKNVVCFCENPEDAFQFRKEFFLKDIQVQTIAGTGIDLEEFGFKPLLKPESLKILCVARLLKTKGLGELATGLKQLKAKNIPFECWILGMVDRQNADAFSEEWILENQASGIWIWKGFTEDVKPFLEWSNLVVLLSYREGLPVSLLEALAVGRGIITTDTPGCRETVINGVNGFLVPVKDSEYFVNHLIELSNNLVRLVAMCQESRRLAEAKFDRKIVNKNILKHYDNKKQN
jgi:glycosyltransferase involved in cell wall biosynthesis